MNPLGEILGTGNCILGSKGLDEMVVAVCAACYMLLNVVYSKFIYRAYICLRILNLRRGNLHVNVCV